jgi:hypothetical protein
MLDRESVSDIGQVRLQGLAVRPIRRGDRPRVRCASRHSDPGPAHTAPLRIARATLVASLVLLCSVIGPQTPALAAPSGLPASWDKGYTFTSWWNDQYAGKTADDSFAQMRATNPNAVAFISTWYTDDLRGSRIAPRAQNTPSDASLATIIGKARAGGLRTFLRPIVDSYTGGWRGDYAPRDPSAWFRSYRTFIFHYADLARELHVDTFAVGAELKSMTVPAYSNQWRSIIAGVRARFPGRLTYSGVYGDQVDWWDALDAYGINWYMPLAAATAPGDNTLAPRDEGLDEAEMVGRWSRFTDEYGITYDYLGWLQAQFERWRKPILFTELGYPSKRESLLTPFSWFSPSRTVDTVVQARAYDAALNALADKSWVAGVYVWQWLWNDEAIDPATDTDHSPQNKPAERSIGRWFGTPRGSPRQRVTTRLSLDVTITSGGSGARGARRGYRARVSGRVTGARRGSVRIRIGARSTASPRRVTYRWVTATVRSDGRFGAAVTVSRRQGVRVYARFPGTVDARPSSARWSAHRAVSRAELRQPGPRG